MAERIARKIDDRATVALAVAKIDGLHELTRAEFGDVKERIGKLEGLPERVARLEERTNDLEGDADWRRGPLLAVVISTGLGLFAVAISVAVAFLTH